MLTGVTSNPTIFQKAMSEGDWYDDQLREVLTEEDDLKEVFLQLAIADIEEACDLFRSVWDGGDGKDGYVSMEVDPNFAYDTSATIEEAARFHDWVERPNLYVKIPATAPGLPAIEEMIARGRNINVTLIFSLERHKEVAEAYIRGLERLAEARRRPVDGRLRRELLRLPRRHRGRSAARRGRAPRAEGEARRREREARVPELQGDLLGRAVGRARREGRDAAVVPLGVDLDEEPRVPRRALRRGSDRRGNREHDAARDDRGLPGSRRGRAHARGRDRRGEAGLRAGRRGRRRLRRRHRHARARGRPEVHRLVHRAPRRHRRQARPARSRRERPLRGAGRSGVAGRAGPRGDRGQPDVGAAVGGVRRALSASCGSTCAASGSRRPRSGRSRCPATWSSSSRSLELGPADADRRVARRSGCDGDDDRAPGSRVAPRPRRTGPARFRDARRDEGGLGRGGGGARARRRRRGGGGQHADVGRRPVASLRTRSIRRCAGRSARCSGARSRSGSRRARRAITRRSPRTGATG